MGQRSRAVGKKEEEEKGGENMRRGVNGGDEEEVVRQVGKPGSAKGLCTGRGRGQLDLPLRPPLPPPP